MKTICTEYVSNAGFLVSTLTALSQKLLIVAGTQFGTILVKQINKENGKTTSDSEKLLANINLISNLAGLILSVGFGILSDKIAIYKLMTIVNLIVLAMWYPMWVDVSNNRIGWPYIIGFVTANSTLHVSVVLGSTLLGKICKEETRGTMFGFNGFFGSIGIFLLQLTGGKLYNDFSKLGPIDIGFIIQFITFIVTLGFGMAGKIKI